MGRGRQKAKQTKVARKLKYFSPETDYQALEKELTSHTDDVESDFGRSSSFTDDDDDGPSWDDVRSS